MIIQNIRIKRVRWNVRIYHAVDTMYADEIIDELIAAGCKGEMLRDAKRNLWSGAINSGITYSNLEKRETIMVIGLTSSAGEYWNSIDHERNHLLQHIAQCCDIDPYGEEISYISGEFIREVYNSKAKVLLCECCRNKMLNKVKGF